MHMELYSEAIFSDHYDRCARALCQNCKLVSCFSYVDGVDIPIVVSGHKELSFINISESPVLYELLGYPANSFIRLSDYQRLDFIEVTGHVVT